MKLSLYLETSVIGAYLDAGDRFRRDLTIRWFEHELSEYRACISLVVERELERVAEPHRSGYMKIIKPLERLEFLDEAACATIYDMRAIGAFSWWAKCVALS